jgi:hypothetical protein
MMKRNIGIKRFLALLMSLMLLTTLLPIAAFTESEMSEPEDAMDQTPDGDATPDDSIDPATESDDELWDDWAEDEPAPETDDEAPIDESIAGWIADFGYAYVTATHPAMVYDTPEMAEPIFAITQDGAVLLATEYSAQNTVRVWFFVAEGEIITGYIAEYALADAVLWDSEVDVLARTLWAELVECFDVGELYLFAVAGEKSGVATAEPTEEPIPAEPDDNGEPADEVEEMASLLMR